MSKGPASSSATAKASTLLQGPAAPALRNLESQESRRSDRTVSIREGAQATGQNPLSDKEKETPEEMLERLKQNCLDFVFPPGQKVVPKALNRMVAYCRYGPALPGVSIDGKPRGRLGSAKAGRGPLQEHEEHLLIKEEENAIIADIYCTAIPVSAHAASLRPPKTVAASTIDGADFGEMNAKKHPLVFQLMELTRTELHQLLDSVTVPKPRVVPGKTTTPALTSAPTAVVAAPGTTTNAGTVAAPLAPTPTPAAEVEIRESTIFDAIANALLAERQRRINVVKTATPDLKDLRRDSEVTKRSSTRFYNKTSPKAYEIRTWEDPKDVLRALHRHVYQISEHDNRNAASLSQNVRCLRPDLELPFGACSEGWDNYCCLRGTHDTKISTLRK